MYPMRGWKTTTEILSSTSQAKIAGKGIIPGFRTLEARWSQTAGELLSLGLVDHELAGFFHLLTKVGHVEPKNFLTLGLEKAFANFVLLLIHLRGGRFLAGVDLEDGSVLADLRGAHNISRLTGKYASNSFRSHGTDVGHLTRC